MKETFESSMFYDIKCRDEPVVCFFMDTPVHNSKHYELSKLKISTYAIAYTNKSTMKPTVDINSFLLNNVVAKL